MRVAGRAGWGELAHTQQQVRLNWAGQDVGQQDQNGVDHPVMRREQPRKEQSGVSFTDQRASGKTWPPHSPLSYSQRGPPCPTLNASGTSGPHLLSSSLSKQTLPLETSPLLQFSVSYFWVFIPF